MQMASNLVQSPTETGPGKTRPRQSHAPINIPPSVIATDAERVVIQQFFAETIAFGAIRFEWPALDTIIGDGQAHEYQMTEPPTYTPMGTQWKVQLQLKVW